MTRYWIALGLNSIIILILFFVTPREAVFLQFINSLFYVTALNMIIFLYLLISKGTFFDGVIFGAREFLKKITSNHSDQEKPLPSETVKLSTYTLFKQQFFTLLIILLSFLIIYFL